MEVQKGEWYFSLQCTGCDATIYFSHDPSKGMIEIPARADSVMNIKCPACNKIDDYDRNDVVSREAKFV